MPLLGLGLLAAPVTPAEARTDAPPQPALQAPSASVRGAGPVLASSVLQTRGVRMAPRRDRVAPTRPGPATLARVTSTTVAVRFGRSRDAVGVVAYRVEANGRVVGRGRRSPVVARRLRCAKAYTFRIRALDAAGNVSVASPVARGRTRPCGAAGSADRPGALRVIDVGETSVTLRFKGARGAAAYRVEAAGRTRARTKATTVVVRGLRCGTIFTFTVRALDRANAASLPSPPARARTRACTDRQPPSAPAALNVGNVSDRGAALSWPVAKDPEGNLAGYVVYRDGVQLGRPLEPSYFASNLRPSASYTFTVRARDRAGHVSVTAASATVTTARPVQSAGRLHAFLLASTGDSFADLQANYTKVGVVYPTYFDVTPDGGIVGQDDPLVTRWAMLHGIKVMPRVHSQTTATLHAVLADPVVRSRLVANVVALAARHGYHGVNVDFEAGLAEDRDALTAFMQELSAGLHAQGQEVSMAVSPKYTNVTTGRAGFYDYNALVAAIDELFVMAWNQHWSTSKPGPLSSIAWYTRIADYLTTVGPASKITMGSQLYGMDWPNAVDAKTYNGAPAVPYEWPAVQALIARTGATPQWDPVMGESFFTYSESGVPHTVWFADAAYVQARFAVARARGFGVGAWRLGSEDRAIWNIQELSS